MFGYKKLELACFLDVLSFKSNLGSVVSQDVQKLLYLMSELVVFQAAWDANYGMLMLNSETYKIMWPNRDVV